MAEERLRVLLDEIAKEHKYVDYDVAIKATSSGGANYTTELYLATISAPGRDNIELFAKVSVLGEELRKKMPEGLGRIYDTEYYFYSKLYKIYEGLEVKHGVPREHRLSVCKYYKCNPNYLEEVLVLENLVAKGYKSFNRMLPFTWEYAAAAVLQLAQLHALSFAYKQEHPNEFEKTLDVMPFPMDGGEDMKTMFTNHVIPSALSVIREENKDRLAKYLDSVDAMDWPAFFSANNRRVIIHCDYRASNLMHTRMNGKLQVTPVDFQTLYGGNPVADLMYFIYTGSDAEFRKHHYANLIEFYYTQLSAALRRLKVEPSEVYSKDDFNEDLKALKMFGIMLGITVLSIVTVEAKDAPKMNNDAQLEDFLVKPNELFTSRLNDIVDDFIRWGLL